jgi:hypothetical protein
MPAIKNFRKSLLQHAVDEMTLSEIFQGYENISDQSKKEHKAAFFIQAIKIMDVTLAEELCHNVRDACACSTGGWRLKAMQKIARENLMWLLTLETRSSFPLSCGDKVDRLRNILAADGCEII